ncbi:hypothetical protein BaRGS_00035617, partial [Batillaria attramentaria]
RATSRGDLRPRARSLKPLCKQLSTSVVLYVSTPSCKVAFGPYGVDTRYNLQGKPVYYDLLEDRISRPALSQRVRELTCCEEKYCSFTQTELSTVVTPYDDFIQ